MIPKLRQMGTSLVESDGLKLFTDRQADDFVVTSVELTWLFGSYRVGSYAEGTFFVKAKLATEGKVSAIR